MKVVNIEQGELKKLEGRDAFFLITPKISKNMFVGFTVVSVGGETSPPHSHESEELYFVVHGKGLMIVDGEEKEVGPGDAVFIPTKATHLTKNTGKIPLEFLWVVSPPVLPGHLK